MQAAIQAPLSTNDTQLIRDTHTLLALPPEKLGQLAKTLKTLQPKSGMLTSSELTPIAQEADIPEWIIQCAMRVLAFLDDPKPLHDLLARDIENDDWKPKFEYFVEQFRDTSTYLSRVFGNAASLSKLMPTLADATIACDLRVVEHSPADHSLEPLAILKIDTTIGPDLVVQCNLAGLVHLAAEIDKAIGYLKQLTKIANDLESTAGASK